MKEEFTLYGLLLEEKTEKVLLKKALSTHAWKLQPAQ